MGATEEDRATLKLDDGHILLYVGGSKPYIWIGSHDGTFYDSIDIDKFKDFVGPLRRSRKAEKARA